MELENRQAEMKCPIDGAAMERMFEHAVLGRHRVEYFRCPSCRLLQPRDPHWLEEAYSDAIARTDVGLVDRNRTNWRRIEPLLHHLFPKAARFLDIGGGYGLLCRGMRDDGFDCYTTDPYCENLFAKDFEPGPGFQADALLAFEVMEHLTDPLTHVREAFQRYGCRTLVFSTLVHDGADTPPLDWWYYAFETGQHVSLYHRESLEELARQLGVKLWSLTDDLHMLSDRPLPVKSGILFRPGKISALYSAWVRRSRRGDSKLESDYQRAKGALNRRFEKP